MKTIKLLSVCLLLLCCQACHRKPYPAILQAADTLIYTHPDSACTLLERLKNSILTEPQSTQMYYQLLSIKARDKAYITHTSDSLIQQVLRYYEKKKDKRHLPEAYYYAGRVYSDLGDAPQALGYYQKAAELLEGGTDYKLLKVIYSQMGELFLYQDVYEEAMKSYKKSFQYQVLLKDDRGMAINLCDIGDTFTAFGNADSALFYYKQAYIQAKEIGKKQLMDKAQTALVSLYTQMKQYDSALISLQSLDSPRPAQQTNRHFITANLYLETGKIDSAIYHYKSILKANDIYAQQIAHWQLAKISQEQLDNQSASQHLNKYIELTDTIKTITDSENIRKIQSLYNYQLHEKENNRLKIQNAQQHFGIVTIFLIASILCIAFLIYFHINKHKKLLLQNSLKELKRQKEEQYQKSAQFIKENKLKIEKLETELQQSNTTNINMQKLLLAQKEQILRMNSKIEADQKEQALAEIAFRQSEIYSKFIDAANNDKIVNSQDWEVLRIEINRYYKDFTARLQAIYPVSDIEMKICLLLKIGINVTGIATLTGRSKSAIVSARKKLYEKTHGETGKPEQWDKIIQSL
ncbi:MAG: tetratricopeptide repeat protein [Bacteroides sp.]|nr:tetratricopeptide repeat protein [Bacteroides sp.]